MKRKTHYIFLFLCLATVWLATSCLSDFESGPKGWLQVGKPTKEAVAETRAEVGDGEEIDYLVSITREGVTMMSPTRFSAISGSIALSAGASYELLAESCTKTEAETQPTMYGQPRYAGRKPFKIEANKSTSVTVKCSMANAAFRIVKDASFYYPEFKVTATVGARTLSFENEEQMGYFNVGEDGTAVLRYEVEAVDAEGRTGRGEGEITLRSRNLSKLCLKASSIGYVDISVSYDDTFTPIITDIIISE